MNDEERVTYFGETDARNKRVRFGIKKKDRSRHMYVIGKTGMGKSTLLENLAVQDILNGEGLAFIDPHGKSADLLLEYIPEHRIKDIVYFAPFDLDYPISFNVLEDVGADRRHLVANGLMSAFKKIWVDAWSARMEYILTNILLALLEYPGSTLLGVNRMLVDKEFRNTIVNNISDPSVKAFWTEEYAKYTDKFAAEAAPAIQNKVGQFVANPLVRNIIGQSHSSFDIRKIMDEKKIFIVNLSKGRVGEGNANLLGAMIITKIYLAAMSRADLSESELKQSSQFYLYVDEFQSFANESFADILSEARKYKLNLTIAHQYIEQMTEEVRAAVFGNVGTMAVFRVGAYDAEVFQKEFSPQFTAEDIVNLQQYQMYLKLMIDGVTSSPFSAKGMPPIPRPERMYVQEIIDASREQFAKARIDIEEDIRRWHIEKIKPVGGADKTEDRPYQQSFEKPAEKFQDRIQRNDQRPQRVAHQSEGHKDKVRSSDFGSEKLRGNIPRDNDEAMRRRTERPESLSRDNQHSSIDKNHRDEKGNKNFALHDAIRNAERERCEGKPQNPDDINREQELREAISLNYLKDKREEEQRVKNDEKNAKPQNVLALKEALLGLLGDSHDANTASDNRVVKEELPVADQDKDIINRHHDSASQHKDRGHTNGHTPSNKTAEDHPAAKSQANMRVHNNLSRQDHFIAKAKEIYRVPDDGGSGERHVLNSHKDVKDKEVDSDTLKKIFN